jgi:putative ABC transport system permease protein
MLQDSARRAKGVGADVLVRPPGSSLLSLSGAPMSEKLTDKLRHEAHVAAATGTIVHPVSGVTTVTGVDLPTFNRMSGGFKFLQGGPFERPDDIIVDEYYARQRNVKAGGTINVLNRDWHVCGVVEAGKLTRIALPLRTLQDLTGNTGKISQIYLKVDKPENVQAVIDNLKKELEGYSIYSMEEFTSLISVNNVPGLRAFINVMVAIGIVIGFAVVCLSMYMAVLQRTREIGILKALGASQWYVMRMILMEAAILGIAGSLVGVVLSFAARGLIVALVPASLTQAIVPEWWPIAGIIALVGALLGALYPGLRAARQDPIEALAYE